MKFFYSLVFLFLYLFGFQVMAQTVTIITVDNYTDLKTVLEETNRSEAVKIILSDDFDNSAPLGATIKWSINNGFNVTLDGNNIELTIGGGFRHFEINRDGTSGVAFIENLNLLGRDMGGGINFKYTPIEIINSSFRENYNGTDGGALTGLADLTITNCTFYKNRVSGAGGYGGGAIRLINYQAIATIYKCFFIENIAFMRGGAISVYESPGGTLDVNSCYFYKNITTVNDSYYGPFGDGGAIDVFNNNRAITLKINNSTFEKNEAADDGGAIFIQNNGIGASNIITNSTIVNNKANGFVNSNSSIIYETGGGAIQISVASTLTLENNTIVNNSSTFSGGGLGVHAHQTQGTPSYILKNNIILGNTVTDALNREYGDNVDAKSFDGTTSLIDASSVGNIGIDNGTVLDAEIMVKNVFGTATPSLQTNAQSSLGMIGNPNEATTNPSFYIEMPTLIIIPYDADNESAPTDNPFAKGLADGKGTVSVPPLEFDQEGFKRDDTAPDVGAVEIIWVRFNANGGHWTEADDYESDDNYYFIRDVDKVTYQYAIVRNNGTSTVTAPSGLTPPAGTTGTLSWVLDDATNTTWDFSTPITENIKLKAVWSDSPTGYTVTYTGNEAGIENFPDPEVVNVAEGATYAIVSPDLTRPGYTFLGWKATSDSPIMGTPTGDNDLYKAGDTFTMPGDDVLLTAQWQTTPPGTKPLLQWSVSTTNNNPGSYQDVGNNHTTTVREGVNVYVQIRPVVDPSITWDSWKIDYTAVPVSHEYPMTAPISKTLRYGFNQDRPHTLAGTYDYTVMRLTLYNNGVEVGSYIYDDPAYRHKIVIQKVTLMVSLQWSVSTTTANQPSFSDVVNNSTTAVSKGTPVYLQIRPVIDERIAFDSWQIDYTAIPAGYEYPMTAPISLSVRYGFNESRPHTLVGTYIYTVTRLRLYNGNVEVGTYNYIDSPYRHTIIISEAEESPFLQWSVSTTTAQPSAYRDVEDQSETNVYVGTPVYLQIRPVVPSSITWNSWKIEYTTIPPGYTHPIVGTLSGTTRYTFNEGNPHTLPGTYIYSVTRLILYNQGVEVAGYIYSNPPYRHTIEIGAGDAIRLGEIAPWCSADGELRIPYEYLQRSEPLEYTVLFSEAAHQAGFTDVTEYTPLPERYITIPVNKEIAKRRYEGTVRIRYTSNPTRIQEYPFTFEVRGVTRILEEPVSVSTLCSDDGFTLRVVAEGDELTYQWYHNDKALVGATLSSYEGVFSEESKGEYYVEVMGYCNSVTSRKVTVSSNLLQIQIKWDDVLYVYNTDNRYTTFQWYKDDMEITTYGRSIYYTDEEGLRGTYMIRAYKADGSYDESCPVHFPETTKGTSVMVYPTMVDKGRQITVEIHQEQEGESLIEMYDFTGKQVYRNRVSGNYQYIDAGKESGTFILKVTTPDGKSSTRKIIIR